MVKRTAAALTLVLSIGPGAFAGVARSQALQRVTVKSFTLSSDTASPQVDVPFRLVVTLHVRERIADVQNIDLPILAELELLGDERETTSGRGGTQYREAISVVAHEAGPMAIEPATLEAIDARDGKPKEWYTNGLSLRVAGSNSAALRAGGHAVLSAAKATFWFLLWALIWLAGIAAIVLVVFALARRRTAAPVPPPAPAPPPTVSPNERVRDALAVLRAERTRAAAVTVRNAIWQMVGACEGETLGDVLMRPAARDPEMRALLVALERSAFTHEADLVRAIDDACASLERYQKAFA